ncbi:hypothetical protein [Cellulosilyticum sp. I15G10I2]|uniref:hypothetical protein n=1 Tax=Cellulosilyticum sp. I15G10I2 TaxID=1892843 RepID=UPI00085C3769|nr:hypothetical protein [Cellulosilyticum sp. I15G10I2]
MKKLLSYGTEFMKQSDWKDLALIKFCLCAVGVMWGMALPKKAHRPVAFIVVSVFVATYIPLMLKIFRIMDELKSKNS